MINPKTLFNQSYTLGKGYTSVGESKFAELREKEKQARKQIVIESALSLFEKKPFFDEHGPIAESSMMTKIS